MARKRAYKKRGDYRKGGRLSYQIGGMTDEDRQEALGAINDPNINTRTTPSPSNVPTKSFTQADIDQAVSDLNAGTRTAADLAREYGVSPDYVNQNLAAINTQNAAAAKAAADAEADPSAAEDEAEANPSAPNAEADAPAPSGKTD